MSLTFAIIWIVVWGFIFGIFDDPSSLQILGFIIIGIGGPLSTFFSKSLKK